MLAELRTLIGAISKLGNGDEDSIRGGEFGQLLNTPLLPQNYEPTNRGMVFSCSTAVTGVAPGTTIGTTGAFTLYNPVNSGKNLVLLAARMGYISGTIGAGTVFLVGNLNPIAAAPTGTAITVVKTLISTSGSAQGNVGLPLTTSTLPATPTVITPIFNLTALLASTAVQPYTVKEQFDGEFEIAPGCALSFEAVAAAGSAPLVAFGMTWIEVPV